MFGMTVGEARRRYREADRKDARKWKAVYLYMEGRPIKEIAGTLDTHYENVRRWLAHARKGGAKAVPRRKPTGAPRILTRDQRIRLVIDVYNGPRKCGYKTDTWSYTLIHAHAKKKFGVEISYDTIVVNMHELGFVLKSPRTSRPEAAPPGERAGFRRRTSGAILPLAGHPDAGGAGPKGREDLTPEMRDRIPRRLANSNLPYSYLANPPRILLKG